MNDKSMAAAAVRENGAPSICVFDVNGTLLDIEYIAPVFQRLFGDFMCFASGSGGLSFTRT